MKKMLDRIVSSLLLRLILSSAIVVFPVALTVSWLGAAYQRVMWERPFLSTTTGLFFYGTAATFLGGFLALYPLERWLIRDRAQRSWRWAVARVGLYTLAGLAIGWFIRFGIRMGVETYPNIVESIYFVLPVINGGIVAILFTFVERAMEEVRQREAQLRGEIAELRIEIDEMRRARQVAKITETEYFENLRARARQLRGEGERDVSKSAVQPPSPSRDLL